MEGTWIPAGYVRKERLLTCQCELVEARTELERERTQNRELRAALEEVEAESRRGLRHGDAKYDAAGACIRIGALARAALSTQEPKCI